MADLTKNLERAIDLAEEHCGAEFGEARDELAALVAALEAAREDASEAKQNGYELGLLAASQGAAREDAWQPIETAPREGEVLVQTLAGSARVDDCRSVHFLIDVAKRQGDECWYVAWRPLPAIDQARGKGGAGK